MRKNSTHLIVVEDVSKDSEPSQRDISPSRRGFLSGSVCTLGTVTIAAAVEGCATRPASRGTKSKAELQYQDAPHVLARCSLCKHFYSPDFCEILADPVSPRGWCKAYALL